MEILNISIRSDHFGLVNIEVSPWQLHIQIWSHKDMHPWPPKFSYNTTIRGWMLEAPCLTIGYKQMRAIWRS